jgi:hypothetical protein
VFARLTTDLRLRYSRVCIKSAGRARTSKLDGSEMMDPYKPSGFLKNDLERMADCGE